MSYAGKFLKAKGQACTIKRTPVVTSKVSIKRSTRSSRDLGSREAYWEGLILADALLQSGEVVTIYSEKYLVQSANYDHGSNEYAFFAAKSNALLTHKRESESETLDENNNPIKSWPTINTDVVAYGEIVTYRLRQEDPGLLDSTKYVFQVSKSIGAKILDRVIHNGENLKVSSVDNVGLPGVDRIQTEIDLRP